MKKSIFLILTLAIPVGIFLFLKIFGNNEFVVPVFFENGIPGCEASSTPHQVPSILLAVDSAETVATGSLGNDMIFGLLSSEDSLSLNEQAIQLVRIQDAFYEVGSPTFVLLANDKEYLEKAGAMFSATGLEEGNVVMGIPDGLALGDLLQCGLGLKERQADTLVLVDRKKRIRGMYNWLDMEQTEQLILELKILRKQHE